MEAEGASAVIGTGAERTSEQKDSLDRIADSHGAATDPVATTCTEKDIVSLRARRWSGRMRT